MNEIIGSINSWMRGQMPDLCMAIIATILVIYGNEINNVLKRHISQHPFYMRLLIFILVAAFGYGLATVLLTKVLIQFYGSMPTITMIVAMIGTFVLLGFLAE